MIAHGRFFGSALFMMYWCNYRMSECKYEPVNINIGDLVVFKYEQKNPNKFGLVLKKEMRAMPRYAMGAHGADGAFVDPLVEETMSCYCLWTTDKKHKKWWVPSRNLTLVKKEA